MPGRGSRVCGRAVPGVGCCLLEFGVQAAPGGVGVALRALAADGRTLRYPSRQMKAMCAPWARGGLLGSGWEARDYSTVGRFRRRWGWGYIYKPRKHRRWWAKP